MVINRIDIEECKDIDILRRIAIEQYKTLFCIGEAIADVDDYSNLKDCFSKIMQHFYDYNIKMTELKSYTPIPYDCTTLHGHEDLSADEIIRMLSALSEIATKHSTDNRSDKE